MGSPSPRDVVAAAFAAFEQRDLARFLRHVDEDVEWLPASSLLVPAGPEPAPYRGHDGIREWFADAGSWIGYGVRIVETLERHNRVYAAAVATLVGETAWLTRAVYFVFTVHGERIASLRSWESEGDARTDAGLPPASAELASDAHSRGSLRVEADPSQLAVVRGEVRTAATEAGLGPEETNDLLVALTEAVTNAIAHGRPAPDGTIGVRWAHERDRLAVCVDDNGSFGDDESSEHHGRGIAVMRLLVDELAIDAREGRTVVRLAKLLPPGS